MAATIAAGSCVRVVTERTRRRTRERIELLADAGMDADTLRREAIEILRATVGFDRWCTLLLDPTRS